MIGILCRLGALILPGKLPTMFGLQHNTHYVVTIIQLLDFYVKDFSTVNYILHNM